MRAGCAFTAAHFREELSYPRLPMSATASQARSPRSVSPLGSPSVVCHSAVEAGSGRRVEARTHSFAHAHRSAEIRCCLTSSRRIGWCGCGQRHCCTMRASCSTRRTRRPTRTFGRRSPLHLWLLTHDAVDACNVEANDVQRAAYSIQHTACYTQRAACSIARCRSATSSRMRWTRALPLRRTNSTRTGSSLCFARRRMAR